MPGNFKTSLADRRTWHTYGRWKDLGVQRADGKAFPAVKDRARLWLPVADGPAFLLGQNFYAARSYNPSYSYALALVHLVALCFELAPHLGRRLFAFRQLAP